MKFCRVNKRSCVSFSLFHQKVSDSNQLVVRNHVNEEANKTGCSLLVLRVSEGVRTPLGVTVLERYWDVFTREAIRAFVFRDKGEERVLFIAFCYRAGSLSGTSNTYWTYYGLWPLVNTEGFLVHEARILSYLERVRYGLLHNLLGSSYKNWLLPFYSPI